MALRSQHSDVYKYLSKVRCNGCPNYEKGCGCGECFWRGISIPPEKIPECSKCKEDTHKFNYSRPDLIPLCSINCIWWDWHHQIRQKMVLCTCDGGCTCGKIKYKQRDQLTEAMKTLMIGTKTSSSVKKIRK